MKQKRRGVRKILKWESSDASMVNFLSLVNYRIQDTQAAAPFSDSESTRHSYQMSTRGTEFGLLVHLIFMFGSNNHVRPLSFLSFIKWAHIPFNKKRNESSNLQLLDMSYLEWAGRKERERNSRMMLFRKPNKVEQPVPLHIAIIRGHLCQRYFRETLKNTVCLALNVLCWQVCHCVFVHT